MVHQLPQQPAPLLPEEVGPRQAAVSANHAQVGDAAQHQVVRCLQASLVGAELFTAGAADHCPALAMTSGANTIIFFSFFNTACVCVLCYIKDNFTRVNTNQLVRTSLCSTTSSSFFEHQTFLSSMSSNWNHSDKKHSQRLSLTTCSMLETLSHVASLMLSPPSTIP